MTQRTRKFIGTNRPSSNLRHALWPRGQCDRGKPHHGWRRRSSGDLLRRVGGLAGFIPIMPVIAGCSVRSGQLSDRNRPQPSPMPVSSLRRPLGRDETVEPRLTCDTRASSRCRNRGTVSRRWGLFWCQARKGITVAEAGEAAGRVPLRTGNCGRPSEACANRIVGLAYGLQTAVRAASIDPPVNPYRRLFTRLFAKAPAPRRIESLREWGGRRRRWRRSGSSPSSAR